MGEFVGRHAELRELLGAARRPGLVVHGIGGIGKSALVAELLRRMRREQPGGRIVRVPGTATAADVVIALGDPRPVTGPITLVIDDFATVSRPGAAGRAEPVDAGLAGFLTAWIREPSPRRLVITSRRPFVLPGDAHRRLAELPLGPLGRDDADLLMDSLPGLAALTADQRSNAWAFSGGHPRALQYLDTLLCHGGADFAELAERLERVLSEHGVGDPARWAASLESDDPGEAPAGRLLAEVVTATVDDVLVHDLLEARYHAYRDGDQAQRLGDEQEARGHHHRARVIDERLGQRAGLAGWQRLGLLSGEPGDLGDPAEVERNLRKSLAVDAELGNRAAVASGLHRLGLVCTLTGRLSAAVGLHCRAFATELALGSPDVPLELADLSRLRAALGEAAFRRAATEVLPEESMRGLARMLDDFVTATEHRYN